MNFLLQDVASKRYLGSIDGVLTLTKRTTFELQWEEVKADNAPEKHYKLTYFDDVVQRGWWNKLVVGKQMSSHVSNRTFYKILTADGFKIGNHYGFVGFNPTKSVIMLYSDKEHADVITWVETHVECFASLKSDMMNVLSNRMQELKSDMMNVLSNRMQEQDNVFTDLNSRVSEIDIRVDLLEHAVEKQVSFEKEVNSRIDVLQQAAEKQVSFEKEVNKRFAMLEKQLFDHNSNVNTIKYQSVAHQQKLNMVTDQIHQLLQLKDDVRILVQRTEAVEHDAAERKQEVMQHWQHWSKVYREQAATMVEIERVMTHFNQSEE
jgi:hypothetical protein